MSLPVGARVRVLRDPDFGPGPWPAEPTGRIEREPEQVQTRQGTELTYRIEFDESQLDTDGEGPYRSSQVLERYLVAID